MPVCSTSSLSGLALRRPSANPLNPINASHWGSASSERLYKIIEALSLIVFNVEKGTNLEPYDKKILAKLSKNCNIYRKLVLLIKLDTQAYYNIRMALGLETV